MLRPVVSPTRTEKGSQPVPTEIIADIDRLQTRVAIMRDGRLLELKYETEEDVVGNIYLGKVTDVIPGLDAAFVNCGIERNVFLHVSDALLEEPPRGPRRGQNLPRIQDVVKAGEEFLVQVTKGPLELKGARATRRLSLPGRYMVLTTGGGKVGVSKKIEDEAERKRLRDLAAKVRDPAFGVIVRTRAEDATQEQLEADVRFLVKVWRAIENRARGAKAPALIHEDVGLVFEMVRDVFSADVDHFVLSTKVAYDQVLNLLNNTAPHLRDRVELYRGHQPIFEHYGVEKEIDRALQLKVGLPHGGGLVVDTTEALTTVDVNSGKFTGAGSLEQTVLTTNLEACEEVARQLRLRDIGGIIVIDFIDMDKPAHRKQVMTALRKAFANDRMRTRIMHLTRLGLVEMTRKRTGESLRDRMQVRCPCCGQGRILAPETVAHRTRNEMRVQSPKHAGQAIHVLLDPLSALAAVGPHGSEGEALEQELGVPVYVRATHAIHPESYYVTFGDPAQFEKEYQRHKVGQILEIAPDQAVVSAEPGFLLALVDGCLLEVPELSVKLDKPIKVRLTRADHSYLRGTPASQKR